MQDEFVLLGLARGVPLGRVHDGAVEVLAGLDLVFGGLDGEDLTFGTDPVEGGHGVAVVVDSEVFGGEEVLGVF